MDQVSVAVDHRLCEEETSVTEVSSLTYKHVSAFTCIRSSFRPTVTNGWTPEAILINRAAKCNMICQHICVADSSLM